MPRDLIVVHHCLLNPTVRAEGAVLPEDVVVKIIEHTKESYLIQLPCPELLFVGISRPPKVKEDYDCPEFRKLCKKLAKDLKNEVEKSGREIREIIGVDASPSCGVFKTHTREGRVKGSGILVEEIRKLFPEVEYKTYQELSML